MTFRQIAMLVSFSLLLATGQILFKFAAASQAKVDGIGGVFSLLTNGYFIAAGCMYALTTILWVIVLQQVPLSRAYPFAALGFVIVPAAAAILFGEQITPRYVVGALLIMVGIVLAAEASAAR